MKQRTLVLVLLAATVIAAGCTGSNAEKPDEEQPDTPEEPTTDSGSSGNNTVFYTDSGFEPSTLTVEQGETITWLDRSSASMWVAVDRHPSHRDYDGTSLNDHCPNSGEVFDQCSTGNRYSFTFDKKGEWRYHNHRSASDTGTVVVE